jgi:acyl carrier protein
VSEVGEQGVVLPNHFGDDGADPPGHGALGQDRQEECPDASALMGVEHGHGRFRGGGVIEPADPAHTPALAEMVEKGGGGPVTKSDDPLATVRAVLARIAPEADIGEIDPNAPLQEALDIDSIDFLKFVDGLHERTGVEVPERDYPRLASLNGCLEYLRERVAV